VQLDARRSPSASLKRPGASPLATALRCARVAATFTTIALLWSLWSSPGVGAWLGLLRRGLAV
jgi:hypothetical protein